LKQEIHGSIHKAGRYFVAADPITNVADQGLTEDESSANLKRGLEGHYEVLLIKVLEHFGFKV
jgi:predicted RNase H-like HicB family nuclease